MYEYESLMYNLSEDLLVAMENKNYTRQDIMKKWKKTRYFVNRTFNGTNTKLTLVDLFELANILDIKLKITLEDPQ